MRIRNRILDWTPLGIHYAAVTLWVLAILLRLSDAGDTWGVVSAVIILATMTYFGFVKIQQPAPSPPPVEFVRIGNIAGISINHPTIFPTGAEHTAGCLRMHTPLASPCMSIAEDAALVFSDGTSAAGARIGVARVPHHGGCIRSHDPGSTDCVFPSGHAGDEDPQIYPATHRPGCVLSTDHRENGTVPCYGARPDSGEAGWL